MDIKENYVVWSISFFFDEKKESISIVNEVSAQEIRNQLLKRLEGGKCMRGLKIIFGHRIMYHRCFPKYAWLNV